jgi:hypothetical protein
MGDVYGRMNVGGQQRPIRGGQARVDAQPDRVQEIGFPSVVFTNQAGGSG